MTLDSSSLSAEIQQLFVEGKIKLVDKPSGMTSHDVVNQTRRQTGVKRVGHAGTLDPLATGLLIVLIGREATRVQDQLLHMEKEYQFTAQLGKETDTYDAQGIVTKEWPWEQVKQIDRQQVESALKNFVGEYDQQVPAYSAVKRDGRKLYELAREHQQIDLPVRRVRISSLELTDFTQDLDRQQSYFSCRVSCGAGTYIRSLAVDIGHALGIGANVTILRRTRVGPFMI